jgi:hypothetical protein
MDLYTFRDSSYRPPSSRLPSPVRPPTATARGGSSSNGIAWPRPSGLTAVNPPRGELWGSGPNLMSGP